MEGKINLALNIYNAKRDLFNRFYLINNHSSDADILYQICRLTIREKRRSYIWSPNLKRFYIQAKQFFKILMVYRIELDNRKQKG